MDRRPRPRRARPRGSLIGWPTDAFLARPPRPSGTGATASGRRRPDPSSRSAAGFALAALAVVPLVTGRDILRVGIGLVLLLDGALLVRTGLGGTPDPLEQVLTAGLVATLGGAVAILAAAARSDGPGTFEMSATTPHRPSHVAEADASDAADAPPQPQPEPPG